MIPIASSIPEPIVREHVARLADLMRERELAAVIVFDPSNMLAFTGTPHASWDRLTCGVVTRDGDVHVVCPLFERPAVAGAERIATIHTWREEENPYATAARALSAAGVRSGSVGVDGRVWLDAWYRFADALGSAVRLHSAEALLREVRLCKSPAEQRILREAHRRGEQVFLELRRIMRAGATEIGLYQSLASKFEPQGLKLDTMIQSGPNGAIPHNPTGTRVLTDGDTVVVDSVVTHEGYTNDLTRTFAVGTPGQKAKQAYRAVREAHDAAIAAVRPGVECQQLDRIARDIITRAGFGEFFIHRLGHGLGIECHEPPYLVGGNRETLRPGMCFSIEPGIYVRGEFGIRIEDDVLVTDSGCEVIRGELPTDVSSVFD